MTVYLVMPVTIQYLLEMGMMKFMEEMVMTQYDGGDDANIYW